MGNICGCRDKLDFADDSDDESLPSTFLPLLSPTQRVSSKQNQAVLLTYNIFVRPPPVNNYGDDYKSERLLEFLKVLPNYDIVCLQEMFATWSTRREKFVKLAKKAGFKYYCESPLPSEFFSTTICDGGLLTLSKYPIAVSEFKPFPKGLGPDYIVWKGVLYSKIEIGKGFIHIFSTHTQASYTKDPKYLLLHVEQFLCFRKFVEEMLKKNFYRSQDLVLFVGDFNVDSRDELLHDTQTLKKLCPELLRYSSITSKEHFCEYDMLLSILSDDFRDDIQELYHEQHGSHPVTFGDCYEDEQNNKVPKENALTHESFLCSSKRLDFIFKFVPHSILPADDISTVKLDFGSRFGIQDKSAEIEKFLVSDNKFTQLSDHYGMKVTIKLSKSDSSRSDDETTYLSTSPEHETSVSKDSATHLKMLF